MSGVEPKLNEAKAWTVGRSSDVQGTLSEKGARTGLGLRRVLRTPNRSVWKCWDRNFAKKPASWGEHLGFWNGEGEKYERFWAKNRATSRRSGQHHDVTEKLDYQRRDVPESCIFNVAMLKSNVATLQRGVFSTSRCWDPTSRCCKE